MTAPHASARPALRVRTSHCLALALACLMTFAGLIGSAWAQTATPSQPEQAYVAALTDQALKILTDKSLDQAARDKSFQSLILANLALDRVAPFALGRYASAMRSSGHYDEYQTLFGQYIARFYATQLQNYTGQRLHVDKSMPHGEKDFVVFSVIEPGSQGGDPLEVNWRVQKTASGFLIVDVQVVGAWMSQAQQEQFVSIISNNNRDVTKLLDYLRQHTAEGSPPPPPLTNNTPTGLQILSA